jgi:hypothetical protein
MFDIICQPLKQLILLECVRYPSVEALSKIVGGIISTREPVILKWAEGVVFSCTPLAPSTNARARVQANHTIGLNGYTSNRCVSESSTM